MDSLTLTIIFIILSTAVGAFIKGRMRDKCLLNFAGDLVNIELKNGKVIWGILELEATGFELKYKMPYLDKNNNIIETSFVFYKNEYSDICCIVRFISDMDDRSKKRRTIFLDRAYSQKRLGRVTRKIRNIFATIRDSIMEVISLFMGRAKQMMPAKKVLSSQGKYVSQMEEGVFSSLKTSFEPLLEKHIGKKVILQLSKEGKIVEYLGVLKGYTPEFIELMDLDYRCCKKDEVRKADIIVPRSLGLIRHLSK